MTHDFATAMARALEQTRAGDPAEATRTIQAALASRSGRGQSRDQDATPGAWRPERTSAGRIVDAEVIEQRHGRGSVPNPEAAKAPAVKSGDGNRSLREVVDLLSWGRKGQMPMRAPAATRLKPPSMPQGARYETRRFSCAAGSRDYFLYVPAALPEGPQGVVLMLHGCTQDADDFARGTDMNRVAERYGLIIAYPEQTRAHNTQACWNWFRPGDQGPNGGEPEILAGLARKLAAEFGIAEGRAFVAGLSAGGGMAAILGITHPEIFSAVGIHSGLPHGAAHDVVSAFAAMRGDAASSPARSNPPVRTIVFHGSADPTVHPANADRIVEAAAAGSRVIHSHESGRSRGGRIWSRTTASTPDGTALTEEWRIEGAGHAWSGGAAAGSYTDPTGPDASEEMVRFFMAGLGAEA